MDLKPSYKSIHNNIRTKINIIPIKPLKEEKKRFKSIYSLYLYSN